MFACLHACVVFGVRLLPRRARERGTAPGAPPPPSAQGVEFSASAGIVANRIKHSADVFMGEIGRSTAYRDHLIQIDAALMPGVRAPAGESIDCIWIR